MTLFCFDLILQCFMDNRTKVSNADGAARPPLLSLSTIWRIWKASARSSLLVSCEASQLDQRTHQQRTGTALVTLHTHFSLLLQDSIWTITIDLQNWFGYSATTLSRRCSTNQDVPGFLGDLCILFGMKIFYRQEGCFVYSNNASTMHRFLASTSIRTTT